MNDEYFEWLCDLIQAEDYQDSYNYLIKQMYETPFDEESAVLVRNDKNRIADARRLSENLDMGDVFQIPLNHRTSVLEILIALAFRIEDWFGEKDAIYWFWIMITNIGLIQFTDEVYRRNPEMFHEYVNEILVMLLTRTYCSDGQGGLFPSKKVKKDLRNVEIWYQMAWYLDENY